MIAFYGCIGVAVLLFVLLFFLGSGREKDDRSTGDWDFADAREASCPSEVVKQIFCAQDSQFVAREGSPQLRHFFIGERRRVAIGWIRRTSLELRMAMREHVHVARQKEDIDVATEARVLLQYLRLRCLCGLLLASAMVVRPSGLRELAVYASELSRRLDAAHSLVPERAAPRRVHSTH